MKGVKGRERRGRGEAAAAAAASGERLDTAVTPSRGEFDQCELALSRSRHTATAKQEGWAQVSGKEQNHDWTGD